MVVVCPFRYTTSDHLGSFTSSQLSHWCSLRWLYVISYVPLMLTKIFFASSQVYHCHSLMLLCNFPDVPLLLPRVAPHHFRCLITTHSSGSVSSQVSHCCSLGRLGVVLGVTLPFTLVSPHCLWCPSSSQWGFSALFQVSHCCSQVQHCNISDVTDGHWGVTVSSQVSNCCSHVWLYIIPGVLLPLYKMGLCHLGVSKPVTVQFCIVLCVLLLLTGGLWVVSVFPLLLTEVAKCHQCVSLSLTGGGGVSALF